MQLNINLKIADPSVFDRVADLLSANPEQYEFMRCSVPGNSSPDSKACALGWLMYFNGEKRGTSFTDVFALRRLGYDDIDPLCVEAQGYEDFLTAMDYKAHYTEDGQVRWEYLADVRITGEDIAYAARRIAEWIRTQQGMESDV